MSTWEEHSGERHRYGDWIGVVMGEADLRMVWKITTSTKFSFEIGQTGKNTKAEKVERCEIKGDFTKTSSNFSRCTNHVTVPTREIAFGSIYIVLILNYYFHGSLKKMTDVIT